MARHSWTPGDIVRLRNMVADDKHTLEMAKAIGVTKDAVHRKLNSLGLRLSDAAVKRARSEAQTASARTPAGFAQRSRAGRAVKIRNGFSNARAAQAKAVEARYAGIPDAYRETYRQLIYSKGASSKEARAMIAAQIAQERARIDATKTPFERMLERAKAGAPIYERAGFAANDYHLSLTGSSLA